MKKTLVILVGFLFFVAIFVFAAAGYLWNGEPVSYEEGLVRIAFTDGNISIEAKTDEQYEYSWKFSLSNSDITLRFYKKDKRLLSLLKKLSIEKFPFDKIPFFKNSFQKEFLSSKLDVPVSYGIYQVAYENPDNTQKKLDKIDNSKEKKASDLATEWTRLLKKGANSAALKKFSLALEIIPNSVAILTGKFVAQLNLGSFSGAVNTYAKILEITKGRDPRYAYPDMGSSISDKAVELIDKFAHPEKFDLRKTYMEQGIFSYWLGNRLYELDSEEYRFQILHGYALSALCFDIVTQTDPRNALAYRYKGVVILDIGSPTSLAISSLEKSVMLDPKDPVAFYKLGNAYRNEEKFDLAVSAYQKSVQLEGFPASSYLNMGNAYFSLNKRSQGYEAYDQYSKACKENCEYGYTNVAREKLNDGKWDDSVANAKKAMEINPKHAKAYQTLGLAFYELGKYSESVEALKAVIALDGANETTFQHIGKAYAKLGDSENARRYVEFIEKTKREETPRGKNTNGTQTGSNYE